MQKKFLCWIGIHHYVEFVWVSLFYGVDKTSPSEWMCEHCYKNKYD